jgi:hypothetical protein
LLALAADRDRRDLAPPDEAMIWYHLTNRPKFKLDKRYAPNNNAITIEDRSGCPGIYLGQSIERWVNGYGYWRPFVVEFLVDPSVMHDDGVHGRFGGEMFVPASSFGKLTIRRVIPIDAHCREEFGCYGWIESALLQEFDTGKSIDPRSVHKHRFYDENGRRNYRYEGPDVRDMPLAETRRLAKQLASFSLKLRSVHA